MRRIVLPVFLVAFVAITAACGNSASSGSTSGLTGKLWKLSAITQVAPAFQGVVPAADQAKYTIEFNADGTFAAKADCNQLSGTYTTTPTGGLTIVLGPSTMAACPPESLAPQYVTGLGNALLRLPR